jgi:hypothetical protein
MCRTYHRIGSFHQRVRESSVSARLTRSSSFGPVLVTVLVTLSVRLVRMIRTRAWRERARLDLRPLQHLAAFARSPPGSHNRALLAGARPRKRAAGLSGQILCLHAEGAQHGHHGEVARIHDASAFDCPERGERNLGSRRELLLGQASELPQGTQPCRQALALLDVRAVLALLPPWLNHVAMIELKI